MVAVLPSYNNHSKHGSANSLSLAMFGTAAACTAAAVLSSSRQIQCEPEILEEEEVLTPLYTPILRTKGMLKVSDMHTISYKVYGNPNGKPVLCVHGGPGAGTGTGKVSLNYIYINFVDMQIGVGE